ncbi:MAG: hypothetical protein JST26_16350 [Bacteroidetes bacterium]|nr:hypothetical protein [Bacteroidota bacterium]
MKTPSIKALVETYSLAELQEAEVALLEEHTPAITIEGKDEGEQLTHVLAAIYIKTQMETKGIPFNQGLRDFSQRVRKSIS